MKLSHIIATAGLALAAGAAAHAQPPMQGQTPMQGQPAMHQRTVVTTHRTTTVTQHGMGWHHPRCHTEYRHHHRVRVCG